MASCATSGSALTTVVTAVAPLLRAGGRRGASAGEHDARSRRSRRIATGWRRSCRRCEPAPPSAVSSISGFSRMWRSRPTRPTRCWRWVVRSGSARWRSRATRSSRNRGLPELPIFPTIEAHIKKEAEDELAVRALHHREASLTIPDWVKHYRNLPLPPYLAPLTSMGVTDDMTGPSRLDQDGAHYIRPPAKDLPYFYLSMARDPRGIIVHEGVPGHYFQLVLSWAHENPLRRHYYDSGSNEGIGFYAEEMMLQAGLFDNLPRSREIIYNFMRLRALRVEVDVRLATGEFTIRAGRRLSRAHGADGSRAPRSRRRRGLPPVPGRRSPIRSASSRSSGSSPTPGARRATRSTSAPSTTSSGRTATCRCRSSDGSCSACATTWTSSTDGRRRRCRRSRCVTSPRNA